MKKVTISESQFNLMKEEVVADGSAEHNPYKKKMEFRKRFVDKLLS